MYVIGILMAPMAASFFLHINTSKFILYVSTATISICTGAVTSFSVATTSDLFGAKNFSINHNIVAWDGPKSCTLCSNMKIVQIGGSAKKITNIQIDVNWFTKEQDQKCKGEKFQVVFM